MVPIFFFNLCVDYFLPTIFRDYIQVVKWCTKCQLYSHKPHLPSFHPIVALGPFCKLRIDFMTRNLPSKYGHKCIVFFSYCFIKWANDMPTFNKTTNIMACFFFIHIIMQFKFHKELVCDHEKHFENDIFQELTQLFRFTHEFASPY